MKKTDLYLKPGTYIKASTTTGDVNGISLENFVVSVLNNPTCCPKLFPETGVPTTFNPLFTDASGTLAGVTATGSYTMISPKICFFRVHVNFSGCTNFGTLGYQITLPFPSIETMRQANGTLHQPALSAQYHIAGITDIDTANASILTLYYSGSTTDLAWKFNTPVGGTTVTSHFDISGVYEIV